MTACKFHREPLESAKQTLQQNYPGRMNRIRWSEPEPGLESELEPESGLERRLTRSKYYCTKCRRRSLPNLQHRAYCSRCYRNPEYSQEYCPRSTGRHTELPRTRIRLLAPKRHSFRRWRRKRQAHWEAHVSSCPCNNPRTRIRCSSIRRLWSEEELEAVPEERCPTRPWSKCC